MGFVKNEMMDAEEGSYSMLDGNVCIDCIADDDLRKHHKEHQIGISSCDFCDKKEAFVAPAEILQKQIMESLGADYIDVQYSGSPYDGEEGDWFVPHDWSRAIVYDSLGGVVSDEFCEAVAEATLDTEWCDASWDVLSPRMRLKYGWEEFCHIVRHSQRFCFAWVPGTEDPHHPDYTSPLLTLQSIGKLVEHHKMITSIPAGTEICRVRIDKKTTYNSIDALGTPQYRQANSSRMSPAGIPMFYGSADFETAIKETWDMRNTAFCSMGVFKLTREIRVVDCIELPRVPGFWSNPGRETRGTLRFLHELAKDFSEPVARGTKEDFHYAPTQIVAEYLIKAKYEEENNRYKNQQVHGLIFKSSKTGNSNFALNLVNSADKKLGDCQNDFLELIEVTSKRLVPK